MIRHVWSVLCRSSVIDKDQNSLSLLDVFEQITLLEPIDEPGQAPIQMHHVTLWTRGDPAVPETGVGRLRLLAPGGDQIGGSTEYTVDLTSFRRLRHRTTFNTFPILRAGVYEFVVDVQSEGEWTMVSRVPFEVLVEIPHTGDTAAPPS